MTIAGGLVIAFIDLVALTNFIRALVLPINHRRRGRPTRRAVRDNCGDRASRRHAQDA